MFARTSFVIGIALTPVLAAPRDLPLQSNEPHLIQARTLLASGSLGEAENIVRQFLTESVARSRPLGAVEFDVTGCDYFLLENHPSADKWLTESIDTASPAGPGPYLALGTLLVENNQAGHAMRYMLKAAELAPDQPLSHRHLGRPYLALDQAAAAPIELLAQAHMKLGLTQQAAAEQDHYRQPSGNHSAPDDPLSEARSLVQSGQLTTAEQVLHRYLALHKSSADGHYLLGYILFKKPDAKASLAEYTEGAKYRRPTAHDLEVVGGDYVLLHDYPDADKWFTQSVEWDPGNWQALYYLGRTKYNENRFDEAVKIFTQCLKSEPKSVKAEDNLGLSLEGLGRTEEAMTAYHNAISWESGDKQQDSGPYLDLGALLVTTDRSPEALPFLRQALAISPEDVRVHRELGKAYLHLDELDRAQAELEKSVQLAPDSAPTHFMLAQLYRKRGLTDKARVEIERYTSLSAAHSTDASQ